MYVVAGSMLTPALRIVRPLKEGAVGNVWVAEQVPDGKPVAVKFLSEDVLRLSPEAIKRFEREAKAAMKLESPHIVQTHDFGTMEDGTPYIVMELLEGESLGERLERAGPMSPQDVSAVIDQVAVALEVAHDHGLVHRDVKPDNIFLVAGRGGIFVKVLDFGTVKQIQQRSESLLTATGMIVGTPEYMSPEQVFAAKDIDHRVDIWGLGAVAYHAVTGHLPFEADSPHALVLVIANAELTPPSTHDPRLSPQVNVWFAKALARSPSDRFNSVKEMAEKFAAVFGLARGGGEVEDAGTEDETLRFQPGMDADLDRSLPASGVPVSAATPASGVPGGMSPPSVPPSAPGQPGPPHSVPPPPLSGAPPSVPPEATVENALLAATHPGAAISPFAAQRMAARRGTLLVGGVVAGVAVILVALVVAWMVTSSPSNVASAASASSVEAPPLAPSVLPTPTRSSLQATSAAPAVPTGGWAPDSGAAPDGSVDDMDAATDAADDAAADQADAAAELLDGLLSIVCNPVCNQVIFEGRALGPSPVLRMPIPAGTHTFILKRAGQPDREVPIDVKSNEPTVKFVNMD